MELHCHRSNVSVPASERRTGGQSAAAGRGGRFASASGNGAVRQRGHRRFTFVEVFVAVFLIGMAIAALISLIVFHVRFSDLLDNRRQVSQLATSRIEQLTQIEFDDLLPAEETDVRIDADGAPNANGRFLRTTTLTDNGSGEITMTVLVRHPQTGARLATEFQLTTIRVD